MNLLATTIHIEIAPVGKKYVAHVVIHQDGAGHNHWDHKDVLSSKEELMNWVANCVHQVRDK